MRANIVLKVLAVVIVAVLIVVLIKGRPKQESVQAAQLSAEPGEVGLQSVEGDLPIAGEGLEIDPLSNKFLADEYNVDVDSPVETMRTLTEETRAVREDSVKLQEENQRLKQEIDQLLKMEDSINTRVNGRFSRAEQDAEAKRRELEHTQSLTQKLIARLESRLEDLQQEGKQTGGQTSASGYQIGAAGIPAGLGYDDQGLPVNYDEVVWQKPIDATVDARDPSKIKLPEFSLNQVGGAPEIGQEPIKAKEKTKEERMIKAYTVPENATLLGSVSMTALLGRIPTNGQVVDPYPFKVMIGEQNLSSNGVKIPGVVGIKMSGIAKGDWTLSCVSGQITSMTFTFRDGTILTIPEPGEQATDPIAWFSDKNGIPCVTGKRITNAVSYLSSRVAMTAASSYANAEAQSQFTTQSSGDNLTSALTGDPKIVAKNTAISSGLNEVTDWLDARQQDSFDAIYIPPGTELAIHITEELKIDYDPKGRKVNHYASVTRRSERYLD